MIKNGTVCTPFPKAYLPGITRDLIIEICNNNDVKILEKDISLTELYNADEVFTTGTMGEFARVVEIDKRKIENKGGVLMQLQFLFRKLTETEGEKLTF